MAWYRLGTVAVCTGHTLTLPEQGSYSSLPVHSQDQQLDPSVHDSTHTNTQCNQRTHTYITLIFEIGQSTL